MLTAIAEELAEANIGALRLDYEVIPAAEERFRISYMLWHTCEREQSNWA
jgi:hypothetical protein